LIVAGYIVPTPRTFQRWLESENLQGGVGRPPNNNATFS
jgi:hypothetical protein